MNYFYFYGPLGSFVKHESLVFHWSFHCNYMGKKLQIFPILFHKRNKVIQVETIWVIKIQMFHFWLNYPFKKCSSSPFSLSTSSIFSPACRCNNHTNVCHSSSGKCYCTTKGVKGDQCQLWVWLNLPWPAILPVACQSGSDRHETFNKFPHIIMLSLAS